MSLEQRVAWSAQGSLGIRNVGDLDLLLDRLEREHGSDNPIILIVDGPCQESVYFGIGGDLSFVMLQRSRISPRSARTLPTARSITSFRAIILRLLENS